MTTILISILLSASLVICFKFFEKWNISISQAIAFNYLTAASLGVILSPSSYQGIKYFEQSWFYYSLFFGVLFISVFKLMAIGVKKNGLVAVSIAQKMSLIIPVVFSIWAYNESVNTWKVLAILLALVSVYYSSNKEASKTVSIKDITIPLLIFLGSGLVDISIKITQEKYGEIVDLNVLLTCIFGSAGVIGFALLFIYKETIKLKSIFAGILLGSFNFFSTWFLMKALGLKSMESSLVFAINNIGVILFTTAVAFIFFKEKISRINWVGIVLALISIAIIFYSNGN